MSRPSAPHGRRRRKPRPGPVTARGWSVRYALAAYGILLVFDFAFAVLLPHRALRIGLGALAIDLVMLATLIPLYRSRPFTRRDLGLRPTSEPVAVGLTFLALIVYITVAVVWNLAVIGVKAHPPHVQLPAGVAGRVSAGIALCICAPVTEEVFFRGFLYRALRNRLGVACAAVIVGVLFGAVHASTYATDTLPIKAMFGVLTCLLYERTGSLYPGIALHSLLDSSSYEASISHGRIVVAPLLFLLVGIGVLLRHRFRAPTQAELRAFTRNPGSLPASPSPPGMHTAHRASRRDSATRWRSAADTGPRGGSSP